MRSTWEYMPLLVADAVTQMATDVEMAMACARAERCGLLRLYRMDPPAVTIGRHQRWRTVVDEPVCRQRGWEWARRPTGGGALLHRTEINYAVAASRDAINAHGDLTPRIAFERIMSGLARALELLGCRPTLNLGRVNVSASRSASSRPDPRLNVPTRDIRSAHGLCERSLTRYEITVDGKKAVAAAQWHLPKALLQHGTIYFKAPGPDDRFWPGRSEATSSTGLVPHWWDLSNLAGLPPDEAVAKVFGAVREGLARTLDLKWRSVGIERIAPERIEERIRAWEAANWNRKR